MATTRWERLEAYLFDHEKEGSDFGVEEYVAEMGFDEVAEGTGDIQAYLDAQRRRDSKTLYVLRRVPGTRTRSARWAVGVRSRDARLIGAGFYDDVRRRVQRAFMPDILRIRTINPRAARRVETQINAIVDGAMKVLAAAAQGMDRNDDDDSGAAV